MAIFRQYIAPLLVVIVFFFALLAVSARIFLPSDMAAPAPIEDIESAKSPTAKPGVDKSADLPSVQAPTLPTSAGSIN